MGLRPARTIREINKVPWARFSRRKPRKSYVKAMPHLGIQVFRTGERKEDYDIRYDIVATEKVQLRDNAIEAARQSMNRNLEKRIPKQYYFVLRKYPHNVIRENKMISGAGADRLQKGMRKAYGRPTDRAARIYPGEALFSIYTYEKNEPAIKLAFKRAEIKLSKRWKIVKADPKVKV